jgi:hypothetical protein
MYKVARFIVKYAIKFCQLSASIFRILEWGLRTFEHLPNLVLYFELDLIDGSLQFFYLQHLILMTFFFICKTILEVLPLNIHFRDYGNKAC